jgi:hypothetical protein
MIVPFVHSHATDRKTPWRPEKEICFQKILLAVQSWKSETLSGRVDVVRTRKSMLPNRQQMINQNHPTHTYY